MKEVIINFYPIMERCFFANCEKGDILFEKEYPWEGHFFWKE